MQQDYYKAGAIETITYLESLGIAQDFCLGNCIKYLSRYRHKHEDSSSQLADLKKAQWYLERLISHYENEDSEGNENNESDRPLPLNKTPPVPPHGLTAI